MKNVTFLGPLGATFSSEAYERLFDVYGGPKVTNENYILAETNDEVLEKIITHGGYGVIAMDTLVKGRVTEAVDSFIDLLKLYTDTEHCPMRIIGSAKIPLHFCLMSRESNIKSHIINVLGHEKGLSACKNNIQNLGEHITTTFTTSNGEAARLVADLDMYSKGVAAIGPKSAAIKYNLHILDDAFEDTHAATTFFFLGPKDHPIKQGVKNKMFILFRLKHTSGSLVKSLNIFQKEHINMTQIHSMYTHNHMYDFAIELDVDESKLKSIPDILKSFSECVEKYIYFGPFEIKENI